jgi:outer membrane protein TolC
MRLLLMTFLVALALACPATGSAQESEGRAFVQEVLARNPTLRARSLAHQSLRVRASAEGYWPDPEVSVMLDRVPERMDGEMPMLRYQASQMVMWPGKLRLMEEAAIQRADGASADVDVRRFELVRAARQAYLMLIQNRGYREVNEATRQLLETISRAAIARYGAGVGGHHDAARAEVERSVVEVDAIALEGERISVVAMLNALRDRAADAPIEAPATTSLTAAAPIPSFLELTQLALSKRPELKRMRAMVREETSMGDLARRGRYPDFMTGIWYNQMLGGADTAGVMVGATLPIFSAPQQDRRARAFELSAQSFQSEISGMQAMIRYQVADALRRVQTASRSLELVSKQARPRAEQSFGSALSAYSTGAADIVLVLDAWRALQRMEQARIDAIIAERMALADLEWATGGSALGDAR